MPLRRGGRTACLRRGPIIIYSCYTKCALIRECQPTARDGFARPAETEATCILSFELKRQHYSYPVTYFS